MKVIQEHTFGIARKIVSNMTSESWETIPHSVCSYEADVTKLMPLIKEMNEGASKEDKVTINTIMLKIICEGIKASPIINSHLDFSRKLVRGTVKVYENVNISMPMILPSGEMMTVNMRDMHNKTITEMSKEIARTAGKAKNSNLDEALYSVSIHDTLEGLKKGKIAQALTRLYGSKMPGKHRVRTLKGEEKEKYYAIPEHERLSQQDLEQGTITVSNLGSIYREGTSKCYLLEIIPPQTTVIALVSIRDEAVVVTDENGEKKIEIHQILPMTVAFDHRAYDYGNLVPFFRRLDEIFANPEVIKNWK